MWRQFQQALAAVSCFNRTGIDGGLPRHEVIEMKPTVQPRDWRRVHHSPIFWIGIVLCLAAIAIYVWSDDLSWMPRAR